jgi:hypothetical protein
LLAAEYTLGMLSSDDLHRVATERLVQGVDSQSLACLAGAIRCDAPAELRELFEAGLNECAVVVPNRLEAAHELKLHFAELVAQQKLAPARGAAKIVDLYYAVHTLLPPPEKYAGDTFGIADLLGLYYALDDVAPDGSAYADIEADIAEACRRIAETQSA